MVVVVVVVVCCHLRSTQRLRPITFVVARSRPGSTLLAERGVRCRPLVGHRRLWRHTLL